VRKILSWQPILGGGFRIGWFETLDLTPWEAQRLVEDYEESRGAELRAFAKAFSARRSGG